MGNPQRLTASDLEQRLRDKLAHTPAGEVEDETPETVRAEIRALQAVKRRELYEAAVPERYRQASYADLHPVLQARATVAGWLASDSPTLFLVGPVGTGKTHAGYAVLAQAVEAGEWVYGLTVLDLLDSLRPDAPHSPAPRLAEQVGVLLLDDLAAERATEWTTERLGGILDGRTRDRRRQIVTTNAAWADLKARYGPRTMSRLAGGATIAQFDGPDRRRGMW
jgi:DNA replication protein DnaC